MELLSGRLRITPPLVLEIEENEKSQSACEKMGEAFRKLGAE